MHDTDYWLMWEVAVVGPLLGVVALTWLVW